MPSQPKVETPMADEHYPTYERPSGWNALLPRRRPKSSLTTTVTCELAIVGAGYTGLAAARRWATLAGDDRVVVLEQYCSGLTHARVQPADRNSD